MTYIQCVKQASFTNRYVEMLPPPMKRPVLRPMVGIDRSVFRSNGDVLVWTRFEFKIPGGSESSCNIYYVREK